MLGSGVTAYAKANLAAVAADKSSISLCMGTSSRFPARSKEDVEACSYVRLDSCEVQAWLTSFFDETFRFLGRTTVFPSNVVARIEARGAVEREAPALDVAIVDGVCSFSRLDDIESEKDGGVSS
jgi:hypothetical protein